MEKQTADGFTTEDVTFRNGRVKLAGTLMKPKGPGPWPAVVFVHGSGPEKRRGGNPRDPLAMVGYFAERGIAVLTYDKRGVGKSTGDWTRSGFDDLAADGLAGVRFLRRQPGILRGAVGVWGCSQGGWIAPLMASRSRDVAFIVIVSSPGVSGIVQDRQRRVHELLGHGFSRAKAEAACAEIQDLFWREARPKGDAAIRRAIPLARRRWWWPHVFGCVFKEDRQLLEGFRACREGALDPNLDPAPILRRVRCPVLAIYGAKDRMVPVAENKPLLERFLREGGNRDVTIKVFPGGNHGLWLCRTGTLTEIVRMSRQKRLRRYVPGYRELMVRWIKSRTASH
jgi:hypothetical protein